MFLDRFFGKKKEKSGAAAKDRLQFVLVHDRSNCDPHLLELIRGEILQVLSKYVDIDEQTLDIRISENEKDFSGKPALIANIPIIKMRRTEDEDDDEVAAN